MPEPASPPCHAAGEVDADQARDVARWRAATRPRLIAARAAAPAAERAARTARLTPHLDAALARLLGGPRGRTLAICWPFRGEPDLRGWAEAQRGAGAGVALPVVVAKGAPLVFRLWSPGQPLARGPWGILQPDSGTEVVPDLAVAPVVGFDDGCFRLGYGGGFFDRTLALLAGRTVAVGVGDEAQRLPTIFPQPHDVPMAAVATEAGLRWREAPR